MKDQIRKEKLSIRKALTAEEVENKSSYIFLQLKKFFLVQEAKNISVYVDFRNEVKTNQIIQYFLSVGKNVMVPISIPSTKQMQFSQLLDPAQDLITGNYGILEPKQDAMRIVDPNSLDLILVPGVAFDSHGYRIGYGGGYYDRFFSQQNKKIPSIALAFDLQIVEEIPMDPFDHPVDYIITETRIIACK
ncbi:5-formyltetrahydrofolate cyclo-ligase [Anaerosolibacter carboniphilus]|uniref:5-formyltetrahydrofolate cyclo-ligase n=1 Tax=Anaerosolibacter carboniphilus TaxID=1417629 RepID=A0A841KUS9_9FIRM|nr:5-formyltetrahydrofolate cyclo-ligase [Anaerosolibacter carboniphilus]MBB6215770.1 5-formyltetrahydrofolate cyclo-ligase [Anaerosolibacter carboniphilus]